MTDQAITADGFTLPAGGDLLTNGDDAITQNARAAWGLARKLGYLRGILPTGTDPDTLVRPEHSGLWELPSASTYPALPTTGALLLQVDAGNLTAAQIIWRSGTRGGWRRTQRNAYTNSWWPWVPFGTIDAPEMPLTSNLDTIRENIDYTVSNASNASTHAGWPADAPRSPAHFQCRSVISGVSFQQLHVYGTGGGLWLRQTSAISPQPFPWTPWAKVVTGSPTGAADGTTSNTPPAGIIDRHRLLLEDFERRHPVTDITTGAIAFRFDHGLKNFDTLIRPLLEARHIPYSLVLNSGSWELAENQGVTPAMVDQWCQGDLCEVWNHGQWHWDSPTPDKLIECIVTGLSQLQTQLPSAVIEGWAQAGVGGTGYMGLLPVDSATKLSDTVAGRLMLQHHAVVTGAIPGTELRVLDGRIRQGLSHTTLDSMTTDAATAIITRAQTEHRGAQFMLHPSLVGQPGYMSVDTLTAVLDHATAERDAGRLAILSPSDLMTARTHA